MKRPQFFLIALLFSSLSYAATPDHPHVQYGSEDRQWLDIYLAPSANPTPVYFDAHGNGGSTNMPSAIIDDLKAAGISVVAWESLTSVNTQTEVETGWADAELMFNWVKANADVYNFDTTNFIIGGSSRGSILSWKYGHRQDPNIRGLYMYNALPNGAWADSTWWYPPNEVTVASPPIFFVYKWEPGVIGDSHDPVNGITIMDTYDSLGIGDRDTLVHSIGYTANTDKYQFLVEFALSVIDSDPILSSHTIETPSLNVFPNPFRDTCEISGLRGGEQFILRSLNGSLIQKGMMVEHLQFSALTPGVYFLTIQSQESQSVFKLVKN